MGQPYIDEGQQVIGPWPPYWLKSFMVEQANTPRR